MPLVLYSYVKHNSQAELHTFARDIIHKISNVAGGEILCQIYSVINVIYDLLLGMPTCRKAGLK